jgi:microcystin-dependent protein
MSEPFLSEIKIVAFAFPPRGWALCNGQLLPINQNQALFSLLGTTYGGDGRTTFALPNLQGRAPVHFDDGLLLGEAGGEESHTLALAELPGHTHVHGSYSQATTDLPTGNAPASKPRRGVNVYTSGLADVVLRGSGPVGGSQPHENRQPYLALNFVIALQGIFPSRD